MINFLLSAFLVVFGALLAAAPRALWALGTIAAWDQYRTFDDHRRASSPTAFGIAAYRVLGVVLLALGVMLWVTH